MKWLFFLIIFIVLLLTIVFWAVHSALNPKYTPVPSLKIQTSFLTDHPIISFHTDSIFLKDQEIFGYHNINGPTLVKVPSWVSNPLGKYYLYFSHHKGAHIRMAYADDISGPWKVNPHPVLSLKESTMAQEPTPSGSWKLLRKYCGYSEAIAIAEVGQEAKKAYRQQQKTTSETVPHIASPEIIIDEKNKAFRLYFHGVVEGNIQMTKVAMSGDGLNFKALPEVLGLPYMRIFQHNDMFYAISMPGILYRSKDGMKDFEPRSRWLFETDVRHVGLYKKEQTLYIFYSVVGHVPESIVMSTIDLSDDWRRWKASHPLPVCAPEQIWEGSALPIEASIRGEAEVAVHQLRDPYVFEEYDQLYLLYSGSGEQNIGIRKLTIEDL